MTITLNPPPLEVPEQFARVKELAAFFGNLINTIYQMWTALYSIRFEVKALTTNATVTGMLRTKVPNNRTIMVQAHIVARRTGGSAGANGDSAWYVVTGGYKNINGTLTLIGSIDLISGENQSGWNVGLQTTGDDVVVVVQGAANNNVTWQGTVSTFLVGA